MKRKGFTLIELLAVIVILAIIALIATPIIMNTIEKSRKGAAERSAENYMDAVETAVGTERIDGNILDGEYTIQSDGNLCEGTNVTDCSDPIKIDMSGDKPSSGSIFIDNGIVTTSSTMTIKDYNVSYDENKKSYVASKTEQSSEEEPEVKKICRPATAEEVTTGNVPSGEYAYGDEYICTLKDGVERIFFVLENIESSENISLIMNKNFTDEEVPIKLAWCTDGTKYTTTCQNINSRETNPLKHIQDTFGSNVTVSFPTYDQIVDANNGNKTILPQWLYDYLKGTPHPVSEVEGYWTASVQTSNHVWYVGYHSNLNDDGRMYARLSSDTSLGVRPVITIPKDEL